MSFQNPWWLLALAVVPLAIGAYIAVQQRRQRYAMRFTNLDLLANVVEESPGWKRHVPTALYLLALSAVVIALARPERNVPIPKEQATVVLVTDVSGSMNATDVEPTRLKAAQDAASILLEKLPKDFKIGLVSFSTGVSTLVTPTTDRQAVIDGLESLRANGGTAMGDGLLQALDLARPLQVPDSQTPDATASPTPTPTEGSETEEPPPAIIILLSDGANSTGANDPIDIADEAKERGVSVYTIALGTEDGVVDVTDQLGRTRRVAVPPDPETLAEIAELTEGKSFEAPSADDLEGIYDDLGSKIGYINEKREITWWFAGATAVVLMLAGGLSLAWFSRLP